MASAYDSGVAGIAVRSRELMESSRPAACSCNPLVLVSRRSVARIAYDNVASASCAIFGGVLMQRHLLSGGRAVAGILFLGSMLCACHGDSKPDGSAMQPSSGSLEHNEPPTIVGSPSTLAVVGRPYTFQPNASDPNKDRLTFTIANKPDWASFDANTGRIAGSPVAADIGKYTDIELAVTDGEAVTALPAFSLTVAQNGAQGAPGSVTLDWQAPTRNVDGKSLVNLSGFIVYYGTEPRVYTSAIAVNNPGVASYVVENLKPGTYYFAVTAVTKAGAESGYSPEARSSI
jgi:hypothetical protein